MPGSAAGDVSGSAAARHAVALKATLGEAGAGADGLLTAGESLLLGEWLDRLAKA
ncbi:hypothetical protein [Arthrobacter sp. ISL-69]|uniref:hypothetical protein n=1 Tax=Arthrobacter sp. ISL-69 TaxID=2819113 RepID=UPI001BEB6CAD|nr:hypothetical protein [Arthrobacter sp. ISL-69]MBT2535877.1 hypothetical protein [Arthrobacter sp. ISL-69]